MKIGGLTLDPVTRVVQVSGSERKLSPLQFDLLHYLLVHRRHAIRKETVFNAVWRSYHGQKARPDKTPAYNDNIVNQQLAPIRKILPQQVSLESPGDGTLRIRLRRDGVFSHTIEWLHRKLSKSSLVSYHKILPVDIRKHPRAIQSVVGDDEVLFSLPTGIDQVIAETLVLAYGPAAADGKQRKDCEKILQKSRLLGREDDLVPGDLGSDRFRLFRSFRWSKVFEDAKSRAVKEHLLAKLPSRERGNGFDFNGPKLLVSDIKMTVDKEKRESVWLLCQQSDFYSYRVLRSANDDDYVVSELGLGQMLRPPSGFDEYLVSDFQELMHFALGIQVIVRTSDNRLIIRRRSKRAADDKDGGKLVVSANEGLRADTDVSRGSPRRLKSFVKIINRALEMELFGVQPWLFRKITKYELIGELVYLPNLSINLVFLVTVDASKSDILEAAEHAKDRPEFSSKAPDCPEYTDESIDQFLRKTIAKDQWDEGCLAGLMCTLPAPSVV